MSNLLKAAQELLNNALDAGSFGPGVNINDSDYNEDDYKDYYIDADGDLWYDDFRALDKAIEEELYQNNKENL